ncbi:MAG TPA: hypothetical protein VFI31_17860 [Pirellulales bacterium]|nr:hypothetical protein [Pirellulales bacterium]
MTRLQSQSVMATVVVLHLAVDLLFSPVGWLGCEADTWWQLDYIACGAVLSQPAMLALWAALSSQTVAVRLSSLRVLALGCLSLACGSELNFGERLSGQAVIPTLVCLLMYAGEFSALTLLRRCGWRLTVGGNANAQRNAGFSLRRLFAWTFEVAFFAALLRWLDGPVKMTGIDNLAELLFAGGCDFGFGAFLAAVAMPLVWLLLAIRPRRWLKTAVASSAIMTGASAGAACYWLLGSETLYAIVAGTIGFLTSMAVTLAVLRLCGFALSGRFCDGRPVPAAAADSRASKRWRFTAALAPLTAVVVAFTLVGVERSAEWRSAALHAHWRSLGWRAAIDEGRIIGLTAIRLRGNAEPSKPITVATSQLAALAGLPDLKTLNLMSVKLAASQLSYLEDLPNLSQLILDGADISQVKAAEWPRLAALTTLSLERCQVTDDALLGIARIPHLQKLTLRRATVDDRGLAALSHCKALELVDLLFTNVTPSGVEQLAAALPNVVIYATSTDAEIADAPLPPARLSVMRSAAPPELAEILREFSQVRWLYANGGDTGDGTVALLLQAHERLEYLNLAGADITDAVIPHAKTLTGLKHLDLRRTRVTETGLAQLRRALPECEILR